MRPWTRVAAVLAVAAAAAGGASAYLGHRLAGQRAVAATAAEPGAVTALAAVASGPRIVFRSTGLDENFGTVAVVSLADPGGARAVTGTACERVFARAGTVLCLASERGVVTTSRALVLDESFEAVRELPLDGLPSRARLSGDGRLAATTTFVTGHSYLSTGFSTETLVSTVDGETYGNLEDFELIVDGAAVRAPDRNLWGVSFATADTFYATAASGGTTWLVRGSLGERRLDALRTDAECPSVSPDGTRVVYKKRSGAAGGAWRLALLDLDTGTERLLQETRSVDDQVEWLDGDRILYGLPREGTGAAVTDVWVLDTRGDAAPEVLVPEAWSPAVLS